jgi:pilus assembly protein CpaB
MNRRLATILVLAFVIACTCALLTYRIMGTRMSAARPIATTRVVAAAGDIKIGEILTSANLTDIEIAGTPPKGALLKRENAVGRGVISDLYRGEPILENRLAAPGSGGGMAATIPQGMRACAIKVDDVVGVAGFVTPGMRVDVLVSGLPPGVTVVTDGTVAKTILQNIEVLSAGTDIQKDAEGKPKQVQVVNLLVTPEQAETLSLAGGQLKIQLVLRNPLDTKITPVESTAMGNLFSGPHTSDAPLQHTARKVSKAPPQPFSIEVFNGSKRSEQKFTAPGGTL